MRELRRRVNEIDKRQSNFEIYVRSYIESNEKTITQLKADMSEFKAEMSEFRVELREQRREFRSMIWGGFIAWGVGVVSIIATVLLTRP